MIETIYILIIVSLGLVSIGFYLKDYAITALGSILMIALGIWISVNGLSSLVNWTTNLLATIFIGIGAYIFIRGAYELYKDW